MLFNSYIFIFIFLPSVYLIFRLSSRFNSNVSLGILIMSSLIFYSYWNIYNIFIILSSLLLNYIIGTSILKLNFNYIRKIVYALGILFNLCFIFYYKYFDFFINDVLSFHIGGFDTASIILPLAISFFTFQQITFLSDCYRKQINSIPILNYLLYITFFPQLIAGPIVRFKDMSSQYSCKTFNTYNHRSISCGIFIFAIGLFKKVVIADNLSLLVNSGYQSYNLLTFIESWTISIMYSLQLYYDFSGYCDMAIGLALLFNVKLPINFNSPYQAKNIQDFWRRWHITLGSFLKDFVYIPLGGSRGTFFHTSRNLLLCFLICGIWHGAGFTFIAWGIMHGIGLVVHRLWSLTGFNIPKAASIIITFLFVNLSWVLFRSENLNQAFIILRSMFDITEITLPIKLIKFFETSFFKYREFASTIDNDYFILFVPLLFVFTLLSKNSNYYVSNFSPNRKNLIFVFLLFITSILSIGRVNEFIYYNF
jgi:alginate O-acetyltransferase complex protein AlgI